MSFEIVTVNIKVIFVLYCVCLFSAILFCYQKMVNWCFQITSKWMRNSLTYDEASACFKSYGASDRRLTWKKSMK